MGIFARESTLYLASLFNEGQLLKEKNLLHLEQILSFKSRPYLRKRSNETMRNLRKFLPPPPCKNGGRVQTNTILECSRLEEYIFSYISQNASKCLLQQNIRSG